MPMGCLQSRNLNEAEDMGSTDLDDIDNIFGMETFTSKLFHYNDHE